MVEEELVAMVTEINMADTSDGWWFDSGAPVHVCKDKSLFKTYEVISVAKKFRWGIIVEPRLLEKEVSL